MAKTIVTTAGKPSGTAATAKAIAAVNKLMISSGLNVPFMKEGINQSNPTMNIATTIPIQMNPRIFPNSASFFCNGVSSLFS